MIIGLRFTSTCGSRHATVVCRQHWSAAIVTSSRARYWQTFSLFKIKYLPDGRGIKKREREKERERIVQVIRAAIHRKLTLYATLPGKASLPVASRVWLGRAKQLTRLQMIREKEREREIEREKTPNFLVV